MKKKIILEQGKYKINIYVPCSKRVCFYQDFLKESFKLFFSLVDKKCFAKDTLLSSLLEMLAELLDEETKYYLDRQLTNYLKEKKILKGQLDVLESQKVFSDFYKTVQNKTLEEINKVGYELMKKLTEQFNNYMKEVLDHVEKDFNLLVQVFLNPSLQNKYDDKKDYAKRKSFIFLKINISKNNKKNCLTSISWLGGDRHNSGKQVLLLEFTNGKIVYKPVNLIMDTVIVANLKELFRLLSLFKGESKEIKDKVSTLMKICEGKKSVIEIINENIQAENERLPTYLILPMCQGDVKTDYGYIEYLECKPTIKNSFFEKLTEVCNNSNYKYLLDLSFSSDNQKEVDKLYLKTLRDYVKNAQKSGSLEDLDCVTTDKKDIQCYSYLVGMLYAIAKAFLLTDVHCGNLIIRKKKPYLLDLEVCCSGNDVDSNFFLEAYGSLRRTSKILSNYTFFNNAYGLVYKSTGIACGQIVIPGSNRLYFFYKDHLYVCEPNKQDFIKGVKRALDILSENQEEICKLLNSDIINYAVIREIPDTTSTYNVEIYVVQESDFNEQAFEEVTKDLAAKFDKHDIEERVRPFHLCLRHYHQNQVFNKSVPYYCFKPFRCELFDGEGECVKHVKNGKEITNYLDKPPIPRVIENIQNLPSKKQDIIKKATEEANKFEDLNQLIVDNISLEKKKYENRY